MLLFHLRGTMIFGTSRAISRKNSQVEGCEALVIDITQVNHFGVSAALSLEEAMLDMISAGCKVYIIGTNAQPLQRLEKLGVLKKLPPESVVEKRLVALERAVNVAPA